MCICNQAYIYHSRAINIHNWVSVNIRVRQVIIIMGWLSSGNNDTIETLNISWNGFGPNGAKAIAKGLEVYRDYKNTEHFYIILVFAIILNPVLS